MTFLAFLNISILSVQREPFWISRVHCCDLYIVDNQRRLTIFEGKNKIKSLCKVNVPKVLKASKTIKTVKATDAAKWRQRRLLVDPKPFLMEWSLRCARAFVILSSSICPWSPVWSVVWLQLWDSFLDKYGIHQFRLPGEFFNQVIGKSSSVSHFHLLFFANR